VVPRPTRAKVQLMVGNDVVKPSTNNSGNDSQGAQFFKLFLLTATSLIATPTTDIGDDDAREDA